jgi:enamine deaminase RidA (YjgF/YER057c/UK114 family)
VIVERIRREFPDWGARLGSDHVVDLTILGALSETALTRDREIAFQQTGLPNTFAQLLSGRPVVPPRLGVRLRQLPCLRAAPARLGDVCSRTESQGGNRTPMNGRRLISSGSPLEPEIGFSRAVRVSTAIAVAGTAPIAAERGTACIGDVYGQTKRCLEIIDQAIIDAGARLTDIVRTRIMLTDISRWHEAARAHGEYFGSIRPACTFVQVVGFIDPAWLVEIEADAFAPYLT